MTLFLPQVRVALNEGGGPLPDFPTDVTATLMLGPEDAFGVDGAAQRTVLPLGASARLWGDVNEGRGWVEGGLLDPLDLTVESRGIEATLTGNRLVLRYRAQSLEQAAAIAQSASLSLPPMLTLRMDLYVWIKQFMLEVGGTQLTFGVRGIRSLFKVEAWDGMVGRVRLGLEDWFAVGTGYERLFSALCYYRHARRLSGLEPDRVAVTSEVLLNLAKALEMLLGPDHERARAQARDWGFDERQIDEWIIPLFLLRNKIDVAHPSWGPLTGGEREVVLGFMEAALERVGMILAEVLEGVREGRIVLEPVKGSLGSQRRKLLEVIGEYVKAQGSGMT